MWKESYIKYRLTHQHAKIYETQQLMQQFRKSHHNFDSIKKLIADRVAGENSKTPNH